jgi:hypothetical protein
MISAIDRSYLNLLPTDDLQNANILLGDCNPCASAHRLGAGDKLEDPMVPSIVNGYFIVRFDGIRGGIASGLKPFQERVQQ